MIEDVCGCLPEIHPGELHWEHSDRLLREHNEAMIRRALASDNGPLLHFAAGEEIARLQEKAAWLRLKEGEGCMDTLR